MHALQQLVDSGNPVRVIGTEATATELGIWWKDRGLNLPPHALPPDSAHRLGVHHLLIAIIVDRNGHIAWVKEGYAAEDAAEWRRQLARAKG
jgi:hypothetical protein